MLEIDEGYFGGKEGKVRSARVIDKQKQPSK
jgi:hypothetical protein